MASNSSVLVRMDFTGYGHYPDVMRRLLPLVFGLVALSACGDNRVGQSTTTPAPAGSQTSAAPAASATVAAQSANSAAPGAAVPDALAFKAPLVGGGELNLADYAGKPVLLWFWAPT
jgi:hypothetical protein